MLPVTEKDLLEVKADGSCVLWVYGAIGCDYAFSTDAKWIDLRLVEKVLQGISGPRLEIRVSSGGGHAEHGFAIYDCLQAAKQHFDVVETLIAGQAASMGSIIALAGDTVRISEAGEMMIHLPTSRVDGSRYMLQSALDDLVEFERRMVEIYAGKTGKPQEEISAFLTPGNHYFTPQEALEFGLVDEIVPSVSAARSKGRIDFGFPDWIGKPLPIPGDERWKRGATRMVAVRIATSQAEDGTWRASSETFDGLEGFGATELVAVSRLQGAVHRELAIGFETQGYTAGNVGVEFVIVGREQE